MSHRNRCPISDQTPSEEIVNVITHGLGVLLAFVGAISMFKVAWSQGSTLHLVTSTVYSSAWVLLFSCSTLYHYSRCLERKWRLRIIDHCAIFIVIAASYGPFMAHLVGGWRGYGMWAAAWLVAIIGSTFKWRSESRFGLYSVFAYIAQGWMVMLVFPDIYAKLTGTNLGLLAACGLLITGGAALYDRESLPYHHGIWHVCVLIGSVCLYYCVLNSIVLGI